ncbi:2-hydroxycarboxylate transporter family protein [Weissella tructae]|uniref:Citrate permease P n=1 Tax=Weissella tructae TaxID=887702 RepID=A0ABM5QSS3_9LACO|nr:MULTISPECIES: 2-hydroxycarboxylate transporter family protein [Weissella]AIG65904.1 Citrate permease P [Weissella tructae]ELA07275.1 citrate-sodium symporter [Weissella ceti NC36]QVV91064.1 2-hydroxycarboxylate transporter family protein [Weissella tructae]
MVALSKLTNTLKTYKIDGISLLMYAIMISLMIFLIHVGAYPTNLLGNLFLVFVTGNLLYTIGSSIPFFNQYLGGGAVFTLVGTSLLAMTGAIPAYLVDSVELWLSDSKFIDFFIISLIVGSILGISRHVIGPVAIRFLPVAFLSIMSTLLILAFVAYVLGFDINKAMLYVAFPIMGGGISAGAIPLSELYASTFGASRDYLSTILPAVILGNIFAIIVSGWVTNRAQGTKLDGQGNLLRRHFNRLHEKTLVDNANAQNFGIGLMVILTIYMIGTVLHYVCPVINRYAFIIVVVMIIKFSGRMSVEYEDAAVAFSQIITKNLTHAVLAGVGLTKLDLHVVFATISWKLVLLVVVSVLTITIVAGCLGYLMGLYPLESSVVAGLVNNSMGGTGNLAVLSASNRLNLMGFAQMGNRLGGSLTLVIAGGYIALFT